MSHIRLSNATARRYFLHASDKNDDGSRCCFFAQRPLDEDGWGFWVEPDGTVDVDAASSNGNLPSRRIVDDCKHAAVKFLATRYPALPTPRYEIGGLVVQMTPAAAQRWNDGNTTALDMRNSIVGIPKPSNQARYITLRRACCERLEPEVSDQMVGMPANPIE